MKLVGPILTFDLVRTARRPRFVVARTVYVLLIALTLGWLFLTAPGLHHGQIPAQQMTRFASNFFYAFLILQFSVMVLLTPAYTAGAIAEEKERRTLEFLLATDLSNCEIVMSKLLARLLNLGMLLLAGLPVLGLLQLLGGVDFGSMLAATAATAVTVFSVASLSILNSVLCRRARHAIVLTYVVIIAYCLLGCGAWLGKVALSAPNRCPGLADFPSTAEWTSPVTLGDLVDGFNAGNIPCAALQASHGSARAVFQQDLPGKLGRYAAFHVGVGLVYLLWSMARLRSCLKHEGAKKSAPKTAILGRVFRRLPVGRFPMIWKEVFVEGGLRLNWAGRIAFGLLFLASFLPVVLYLWAYYTGGPYYGGWDRLTRHINAAQIRGVGTVLATLMLLAVVVRAAGSIRSEQERNTLDELLTTPLTNREILLGKWLGAMLSVRWGWAWLGLIWAVGLATGSVQVYGLPVILMCWVVYAAVGAGIGLWFSMVCKTTLRAILASLATMIFLCGGHLLLTGLLILLSPTLVGWLWDVQVSQPPSFVMAVFAYHWHDLASDYQNKYLLRKSPALLIGILSWVVLVPVLWVLVKRRFERLTGRTERRQPPRPMPLRRKEAQTRRGRIAIAASSRPS